jgi:hypothetical protein
MNHHLAVRTPYQRLIQSLQDKVLIPLRKYKESYCSDSSQFEAALTESHRIYQAANETYVTSFKAYLDICEAINSVVDDAAFQNPDRLRVLHQDCYRKEAEVVKQCQALGQAKRVYALAVEKLLIRFEEMEKTFCEKLAFYSATFAGVIQTFGQNIGELGPLGSAALPPLKTALAVPAHLPVPVAPERLTAVPVTVNVFQMHKAEAVMMAVAARMRIAKETVDPEWREFVSTTKGDYLLVCEEVGKDLYVRNDNTGDYGIIAAADVAELPTGGKKNFMKVVQPVTVDGVALLPGQWVLAIGGRDDGAIRCHTALHEVVVVPRTAVKKVK